MQIEVTYVTAFEGPSTHSLDQNDLMTNRFEEACRILLKEGFLKRKTIGERVLITPTAILKIKEVKDV